MIDPRGTRFSAAITTVVLALVIITAPGPVAALLLGIQTLVFACGAVLGPGAQPYGWLFRRYVRPRLGEPSHMEESAPPQFAQAVGTVFALIASISLLLGWTMGVWIFAGFALLAAALNAIFGFCLGCEIYLRIRRFLPKRATSPTTQTTEQHEAQWVLPPTATNVEVDRSSRT